MQAKGPTTLRLHGLKHVVLKTVQVLETRSKTRVNSSLLDGSRTYPGLTGGVSGVRGPKNDRYMGGHGMAPLNGLIMNTQAPHVKCSGRSFLGKRWAERALDHALDGTRYHFPSLTGAPL